MDNVSHLVYKLEIKNRCNFLLHVYSLINLMYSFCFTSRFFLSLKNIRNIMFWYHYKFLIFFLLISVFLNLSNLDRNLDLSCKYMHFNFYLTMSSFKQILYLNKGKTFNKTIAKKCTFDISNLIFSCLIRGKNTNFHTISQH